VGQRIVHFSEYSGRVEEIYLPEDGPTELGARTSIADAEWAEQEARKENSQPGLVLWEDGSRDGSGAVGCAVAWIRTELGREKGPYGILPGGVRRGVHGHCARSRRSSG